MGGDLERQASGSLTGWTLHDALSHWQRHHDPASRRSYLDRLDEEAGALRIGRDLADWWDRWLTWLRENRNQATVNKYAATLRCTLRYAELTGKIPSLPIRNWGIARVPARDVVLSERELTRLWDTLHREAPHLCPITQYALAVPSRKGELVSMRRRDLDLFGQRIRVPNSRAKARVGMWKPIPPDMLDYFRNLPADTDYLFYRRDHTGAAVPLGDFKTAWLRVLDLAMLPDFRFHDMRHIAATAMVNSGTPTEVINQIAGWSTDMLRNYYHRDTARALELVKWPKAVAAVAETTLQPSSAPSSEGFEQREAARG
jgi:integrase